jgi:hypothetical protein
MNDQPYIKPEPTKVSQRSTINGWRVFGFTVITWLILSIIAKSFTFKEQYQSMPSPDGLYLAISDVWAIASIFIGILMSIRFKSIVYFVLGIALYFLCQLPIYGFFGGIIFFAWCYYIYDKLVTAAKNTLDNQEIVVIKIDDGLVYINAGENKKVKVSDIFKVFRVTNISHPVTGEVLGGQKQAIALIEISDVQQKLAIGKICQIIDAKLSIQPLDVVRSRRQSDEKHEIVSNLNDESEQIKPKSKINTNTWHCTCGEINLMSFDKCRVCGQPKSIDLIKSDPDIFSGSNYRD